jgi:ribose/xylose/arabinose/galactoside ABC-type transport system permease subunit
VSARELKLPMTEPEPAAPRADRRRVAGDALRRFATPLVALVLALAFSATAPTFGSYDNVTNIFGQVAVIGVIACGVTFVMLVGGIDLSVGSVALLSASIAAALLHHHVVPPALAIALAVLAGAAVGVVNGALVEGAGINPVIATLGTLIAVRGLAQLVLLGDKSSITIDDGFLLSIGDTRVLGVPLQAIVMLATFAIGVVVLYRFGYGRYVYAAGMNPLAAALCGVHVGLLRASTYVITGALAGVGGILIAAQVGVVTPPLGLNLEFSVITAVILGGTAITGGIGRLEGTLVGAVLLGMVLNYMTIRGVSGEWQQAATGFIILAVATLDRVLRGRNGGRA